jgi:ribonuclease HI
MTTLRLYTDGSCHPPGTIGGWAWILVREHSVASASDRTPGPSNHQRCELTAAIEGLTYLVASGVREVELLSDSRYVVGGMSSTGCTGCTGLGARRCGARVALRARQAARQPGAVGATPRTGWLPRRQLAPRARPPAEKGHERRRPLQQRGRCTGVGGPPGLRSATLNGGINTRRLLVRDKGNSVVRATTTTFASTSRRDRTSLALAGPPRGPSPGQDAGR